MPTDCPEFEYANHPRRDRLPSRIAPILLELRRGDLLTAEFCADSRPTHKNLFEDLTPQDFSYYAGNYRGADFPCLRAYNVKIAGDARVGTRSEQVARAMDSFGAKIRAGIAALDAVHAGSGTRDDKLLASVRFACDVFDVFLQIHPFANGNGHAARLILFAILGRHNLWPAGWTIEPRPADPPYTALLVEHRNGNRDPLYQWILDLIEGRGVVAA